MRSRNSRTGACGNFGAPPKPPCSLSAFWTIWIAARRSRPPSSGSRDARRCASRDRLDDALALGEQVAAAVRPEVGHPVQHLAERRHALPRLGREVRPGEERDAVRRAEHRHRPAAVSRHGLRRGHVDGVHVRTFLAVDLDVHEALVHERRRLGVLERLVLHHVTPVTRRVADRQEDRLVVRAPLRRRRRRPTGASRRDCPCAAGGTGDVSPASRLGMRPTLSVFGETEPSDRGATDERRSSAHRRPPSGTRPVRTRSPGTSASRSSSRRRTSSVRVCPS